ncbi:tetratricopeptide repeat protein [Filimonas effusa]|uniref:Tetratricopeptide repeat protein n=1 Tax=Filimonas effusa TaxID=2508721 RepID=A0A4Q1D7L4_9BACT|nr:hypothetical protein [Filimonas effusa]RXK85262.1 hypothetical protein ESB13_00075 [Filimonas effusa]
MRSGFTMFCVVLTFCCNAQREHKINPEVQPYIDTLFKQIVDVDHFSDKTFRRETYYINKILSIDSFDNSANYMKAQIFAYNGAYDSAINILSRQIKHHNWPNNRIFRSALYDITGDSTAALADYKYILRENERLLKTSDEVQKSLGCLYQIALMKLLSGENKGKVLVEYDKASKPFDSIDTRARIAVVKKGIVYFNKEQFLGTYRTGGVGRKR